MNFKEEILQKQNFLLVSLAALARARQPGALTARRAAGSGPVK